MRTDHYELILCALATEGRHCSTRRTATADATAATPAPLAQPARPLPRTRPTPLAAAAKDESALILPR